MNSLLCTTSELNDRINWDDIVQLLTQLKTDANIITLMPVTDLENFETAWRDEKQKANL